MSSQDLTAHDDNVALLVRCNGRQKFPQLSAFQAKPGRPLPPFISHFAAVQEHNERQRYADWRYV